LCGSEGPAMRGLRRATSAVRLAFASLTPLRCSESRPAAELAALLRRFAQTAAASQITKHALKRVRPRLLRCSAPPTHAATPAPPALLPNRAAPMLAPTAACR